MRFFRMVKSGSSEGSDPVFQKGQIRFFRRADPVLQKGQIRFFRRVRSGSSEGPDPDSGLLEGRIRIRLFWKRLYPDPQPGFRRVSPRPGSSGGLDLHLVLEMVRIRIHNRLIEGRVRVRKRIFKESEPDPALLYVGSESGFNGKIFKTTEKLMTPNSKGVKS